MNNKYIKDVSQAVVIIRMQFKRNEQPSSISQPRSWHTSLPIIRAWKTIVYKRGRTGPGWQAGPERSYLCEQQQQHRENCERWTSRWRVRTDRWPLGQRVAKLTRNRAERTTARGSGGPWERRRSICPTIDRTGQSQARCDYHCIHNKTEEGFSSNLLPFELF